MRIAGNLLIPFIVLVTYVAIQDTRGVQRVSPSDAAGPMIEAAYATVIRWLLMAVLIALCCARGDLDGLVGPRVIQFLIVAAVVFAMDAAGATVLGAIERAGPRLPRIGFVAGLGLGAALPMLATLLLLVPLNAPSAVTPAIVRALPILLLAISAIAYWRSGEIRLATIRFETAAFEKLNAGRAHEERSFSDPLEQIPADAPIERYECFFNDPACPSSVRNANLRRINALPGTEARLLAMLDDDRRAFALVVISQTARFHEPAQIPRIVDALARLAADWHSRADAGPLGDADASTCAKLARLATYFALARQSPGVDYQPAIAAWQVTLNRITPANDDVRSARREVDRVAPGDGRAMTLTSSASSPASWRPSPRRC